MDADQKHQAVKKIDHSQMATTQLPYLGQKIGTERCENQIIVGAT